jgi:WD40 repeat protein
VTARRRGDGAGWDGGVPADRLGELFHEPLLAGYVDRDTRFVARDWAAERIDAALGAPECRVVLVVGEPGAGKTGLLAWLARRHPEWLRYFIRRDQQSPLTSGDARSFLIAVGHQLAARRPQSFRLDRLEVVVRQEVGSVAAGGRAVGVHAKDLIASPFYATAIMVDQTVRELGGDLVGVEADRVVADPWLLEVETLQRLALVGPAGVLSDLDPDERVVVLVDAVDELRYRPGSSEGSILDWLATCPLPPNLRIVVASRPDDRLLARLRAARPGELRELVLDPDALETRRDLDLFVERLAAEPTIAAALADRGIPAARFRSGAAARAAGNFQYAVALARAIDAAIEHASGRRSRLRGPLAGRPAGQDANGELDRLLRLEGVPAGLSELYAFFLALLRDAVEGERVEVDALGRPGWAPAWPAVYQPLLAVLAVAKAPLGAATLRRLTGVRVPERWLADALERLGQFLLRDEGRYRLYHASLAEFLTAPSTRDLHPDCFLDPAEWHARIVDLAVAGHRDDGWLDADPYLHAHLAAHAVAVGRLDTLLDDAGFLVAADPDGLLDTLRLVGTASGSRARRVVGGARHRLRGRPPGERAASLELAARQQGEAALAERLGGLSLARPWRVPWAAWHRPYPHRVVGRHDRAVRALAVGRLDDHAVAVTADENGGVCAWDLDTATRLWGPVQVPGILVAGVSVARDGDIPVAVAACSGAGERTTVLVLDLASGSRLRSLEADPHADGLAAAEVGGRLLVALRSGGPVRILDVETGAAAGPDLQASEERVQTAMATADLDGRPVLVHGLIRAGGIALDVWDLATGTPARAPLACGSYRPGYDIAAVAAGGLGGRAVVAAAINDDDYRMTVQLWDLAAGKRLAASQMATGTPAPVVAVGEAGARPVVVVDALGDLVRVLDPADRLRRVADLSGHSGGVTALAVGEVGGVPAVISAADDGTVRVWDVPDGSAGDAGIGPDEWVASLATGTVGGRDLVVSGSADLANVGSRKGRVRVWDAADGGLTLEVVAGHDGWVTAVALLADRRPPVIATAGWDGTAAAWNLADGSPLAPEIHGDNYTEPGWPPDPRGDVFAVAVGQLDGQPVVAVGGFGVVVLDLEHRRQLGERLGEAWPQALALGAADGHTVVASDQHVWEVTAEGSRQLERPPSRVIGEGMRKLTVGRFDGRLAVAAATDRHEVVVWDSADPRRRVRLRPHAGEVTAVAFGLDPRRPRILTGGKDGVVRWWRPSGRLAAAIDVGAEVTALAALPGARVAVGCKPGLLLLQLM